MVEEQTDESILAEILGDKKDCALLRENEETFFLDFSDIFEGVKNDNNVSQKKEDERTTASSSVWFPLGSSCSAGESSSFLLPCTPPPPPLPLPVPCVPHASPVFAPPQGKKEKKKRQQTKKRKKTNNTKKQKKKKKRKIQEKNEEKEEIHRKKNNDNSKKPKPKSQTDEKNEDKKTGPSLPSSSTDLTPVFLSQQKNKKKPKKTKRIKVAFLRTIAPDRAEVRIPDTINETQRCIVNAIASVLPLDARIMVFGFWHSVILVGAFYLRSNLTFLVLSRTNRKLYLASHFIADGIHLLESVGHLVDLPSDRKTTGWQRKPAAQAIEVHRFAEEIYGGRRGFPLGCIPREILRFKRTKLSLMKAQEFLKGTGEAGAFFRQFWISSSPATGPPPPSFPRSRFFGCYYDPNLNGLTEGTRGWKIFNRLRPITGSCETARHNNKKCCSGYRRILEQLLPVEERPSAVSSSSVERERSNRDRIRIVMQILPTIIDEEKNRGLREHFRKFIDYVEKNPKKLFLPNSIS